MCFWSPSYKVVDPGFLLYTWGGKGTSFPGFLSSDNTPSPLPNLPPPPPTGEGEQALSMHDTLHPRPPFHQQRARSRLSSRPTGPSHALQTPSSTIRVTSNLLLSGSGICFSIGSRFGTERGVICCPPLNPSNYKYINKSIVFAPIGIHHHLNITPSKHKRYHSSTSHFV